MWILSASLLVGVVLAAPVEDEILSLPGWLGNGGKLPSRHYSGLIDITGEQGVAPAESMQVHYYYVEAETSGAHHGHVKRNEKHNANDVPLIMWSNGGPGASSLFGLFTELGPFNVNDNSLKTADYNATGVPTLWYNDFAWNKLGSVLVFDWPPPTGFSFCDGDAAGDGTSCGTWSDTRQAEVSYAALKGFFAKFPELAGAQPLYLTGESYAGVYVPKLGQQIFAHGKADEWRLTGVAIGDACMGSEVMCGGDSGFGPYYDLLFLYGHGQLSNKLWDGLVASCGLPHLQYNHEAAVDADACDTLLASVTGEVGGYYAYNLYDTCTYDNAFRRRRAMEAGSVGMTGGADDDVFGASRSALGGAENDYVCGGGNVLTEYMALPQVRAALHVPVESNFFSGDNAEGMVYEFDEKNLMPFFEHLALHTSVSAMVYNGDTDPSINSFASQNWTTALGLAETQPWRPWTTDACLNMGGYTTHYEGDFQFTTIRGSGHMVPTYKPQAAYAVMRAWLADEPLPKYNSECTAPPLEELSQTARSVL